jgi:hypothetical protein
MLRQELLKDYNSMRRYCFERPESRTPENGFPQQYVFTLKTENYFYYIRCAERPSEYFYVFAYRRGAERALTRTIFGRENFRPLSQAQRESRMRQTQPPTKGKEKEREER